LDAPTLARIDALAVAMSTPWFKAKRSHAMRAALLAGLPVAEAEAKGRPARARSRRKGGA
jgi:hypothetical protein